MLSALSRVLIVERSAIIDNYQAAIFIWEAFGEIRDTLLADTKVSGELQAGDGLLATMSEVTASGVSATRNARARTAPIAENVTTGLRR